MSRTSSEQTTEPRIRKKRRPRILLGLVTLLIFAACAAVGVFAAWVMALKPQLILAGTQAVVELGAQFSPTDMVAEIKNASADSLVIDDSELTVDQVGAYTVRYALAPDAFFTYAEPLARLYAEQVPEQEITVLVRDTTPPSLQVITEPLTTQVGESVRATDLVLSYDDNAGAEQVRITLSNGDDDYMFEQAGTCEVKIRAADPSGNHTDAVATVIVETPDKEAPKLAGIHDAVIEIGTIFDVYEGISATDDTDENPDISADVESVDTSQAGMVTITYTAKDKEGHSSSATREVLVAEHVAQYDGGSYPVYWDTEGIEGQPYLVAVNRALNTVTVYQQDEEGRYTIPVRAFLCSTGPRTPVGRYTTKERYEWKYLFENSWGQYAIRIIDHILFHSVPYYSKSNSALEYDEFNLLGTSASLGCVRLSCEDEKWIYDNCPDGFQCIIYEDASSAGPLGKPDNILIDTSDERRGWDPTDPAEGNPWRDA